MGLTGKWGAADALLLGMSTPQRWQAAWEKAATREAHRLRGLMIDAFQKGGPSGAKWPPLATFTQLLSRVRGRGDRRPLTYHGDLRNSIQVVKERDAIFVGTHRKAKGRDGEDLVNIAMIHNYGTKTYSVRVTAKMRKFFMWLFIETGGQIKPLAKSTSYIVVKIPARPWVEPIWDSEGDNVAGNIADAVVRDMLTPVL